MRIVKNSKTKQKIHCILIALSLSIIPHLAAAAEAPGSPTQVHRKIIVTTPSRVEEPAEELSGSVSILTTAEIEAQNPVTAPEVLRDLPGANVLESGTIGESATLSIRGTQSTQTLILLDGIRLNSPWRGRFDIGSFFFDDIGQVEVVRGGKSALYGSDAIGGVVNLKTTRGKGPFKISYTQEAGSESTFREILSVSGENRQFDHSMTLSRTDTEGQFSRDRYGGTSFSEKIGIPIRDSGRLDLILRYQRDKKELANDIVSISADTVQVVFDENSEIQRRFAFYSLQFHDQIAQKIELSWNASMVDNKLDWDNPTDPGGSNPMTFFEDTETRVVLFNLQLNYRANDSVIVSFGVEQQWDKVESIIEIPAPAPFPSLFPVDRSRRNTAIYIQHHYKWDKRFFVQAGLRHDDNSSYGEVTIPHLSTAYEFNSTETQLRGSWGKGFRAPLIQDLFFPFFGNENLKPEKSEDWELGLRQKMNKSTIDIVYFEIDYEDLIQRSPRGVDNIGSLRTEGFEISLETQLLASLIIKANFTCFEEFHNCFEDREQVTNDIIPFRPWRQGNINLLFISTTALTANLDVNWIDWQPISADHLLLDGTLLQNKNPGFTRVDLSTTYHLLGGFLSLREVRFYLKVRNLFDESYQEVPGFPSPGIGFLAGMTATL